MSEFDPALRLRLDAVAEKFSSFLGKPKPSGHAPVALYGELQLSLSTLA